ncbi:MAG: polyprenol monophosphomannose synthase [Candidatus Omnitrophica bacterium]|nr:polyprenol monophosphomannose synthase [Candidatus Omnitrophota bacterium]
MAQDSQRGISVIIPTLNEAENISRLIPRLARVFSALQRPYEILIADGGSTDGTQEIARQLAVQAPVRLVEAMSGRGLAGDVLCAAQQGRGTVTVVMDADLSHPPEIAPVLAEAVLTGKADVAVGSRYVTGGSTPDWSWMRRVMSRCAGWLARPRMTIGDPTAGFFAVERERLLKVDRRVAGFKILLEIILGSPAPLRVLEIPICFRERTLGKSKMSLKQGYLYLRQLARLQGLLGR